MAAATAPIIPMPGFTCTVDISLLDALGFAQSVRALMRNGKVYIPEGTREVWDRVTEQILVSARAVIAKEGR